MEKFYRRTKVEELGERHPPGEHGPEDKGLLHFVESAQRRRVPGPEIAAAVLEHWGETVSGQVLSNHYTLRVWKRQNAEMEALAQSFGQGAALLELQRLHPTSEREELIEALVDAGIIGQQERLMESDPLKLMAERRKRIELDQGQQEINLGKGQLEVARQNADTARIKAEAELARVKQATEEAVEEAEQKLAGGKPITIDDINFIRQRALGLPPRSAQPAGGASADAQG